MNKLLWAALRSSAMNKLLWAALLVAPVAVIFAQSTTPAPPPAPSALAGSPMHPRFAPLDDAGNPVAETGGEWSTVTTCGQCHDTAFIRGHSRHVTEKVQVDCLSCHKTPGTAPWTTDSIGPDGLLKADAVDLHAARTENCAQCHGLTHTGRVPLELPDDYHRHTPLLDGDHRYQWTRNTGEVFAGQNMSEGYLNLEDKLSLNRPWDTHAMRMLSCTACHYSPNNPARATMKRHMPEYLTQDPRKPTVGQYIQRPDHRLVQSSCTDCHDPLKAHDFLSQRHRHMEVLSCQSCHVPALHGPALMSEDLTMLSKEGEPRVEWRNVDRPVGTPMSSSFIRTYSPWLLPHREEDGILRLAPHNLVTRWVWVNEDTGEDIGIEVLRKALLVDDGYHPDVLKGLDDDENGDLDDEERLLDTPAKQGIVAARLRAHGVPNPVIRSRVDSHRVAHSIADGASALRDCSACHGTSSRLSETIPLGTVPEGLPQPTLATAEGLPKTLTLESRDCMGEGVLAGSVCLHAAPTSDLGNLYVFGFSRRGWSDRMGLWMFIAAFLGILVHGGRRFLTRRQRAGHTHPAMKKVYLYSAYERIWHWLMAFTVILLMVTGLEIHYPDTLSLYGYRNAVAIHNFVAVVMVVNAFLSLFYHLASNAIRQFIPGKTRFVEDLIAQAKYYTYGIFLGAPHPIKKSRQRKLNPLQQVTYMALLNVLFPVQVVTGVLIWMNSRWPTPFEALGGLSIIAPIHNLGSWAFMTFLLVHLYLVTTGHTLTSNLNAMLDGWDLVEDDDQATAKEGSHA